MSRFIDRLNEIGRTAPQPMGFGKVPPASRKPRIAIVASIEQVNEEVLADLVAGADAALLPIAKLEEGQAFGDISRIMADIPWGVFLNTGYTAKIEELSKSGCDFVVFSPEKISLSLVHYQNLGKLLEVGTSLPDGLVRTVNQIPADAVFLRGDEKSSSLTWYDLMLCRHFADLLTKPLIVPVSRDVVNKELLTLWGAGVDGVVVPVGGSGRTVKELRGEIDKLNFPRERGAGRREAVLPALGGRVVEEEEEEEE